MSNEVLEVIAAIMPWHTYKERMRYDTDLKVASDGTIVPVIDVGKFQDIIDGCSHRLLSVLAFADRELLNSLAEVVGNAIALQDKEWVRG
jgi:hypothetical protein